MRKKYEAEVKFAFRDLNSNQNFKLVWTLRFGHF